MKATASVLLALVAICARSQTSPAINRPEQGRAHLDRLEWTLLAGDAAARGLDAYSTTRAVSRGAHEVFLPSPIADHAPAMAGYSAAEVGAQYWIARRLSSRHRRLAHWIAAADISVTTPFAIHNLLLPDLAPAPPWTPPPGAPTPPPIPIPDVARVRAERFAIAMNNDDRPEGVGMPVK
jgi:hypothetical protein